jgi:hypothetical protein
MSQVSFNQDLKNEANQVTDTTQISFKQRYLSKHNYCPMARFVLVKVALVRFLLWTSPTSEVLGLAVVGVGGGGTAASLGGGDKALAKPTSRPFVELRSDFAPLEHHSALTTPTVDRLPANYVAEWPTFVLELSSLNTTTATPSDDSNSKDNEPTRRWKWSRIPDASYDDDDRILENTVSDTTNELTTSSSSHFVNPVTLDTLWHALDLQPPKMSIAVGLHVRNGQVRHVLPALDLYFEDDDLNEEDATRHSQPQQQRQRRIHRNRGLRSVPRAHAWLDFGAYLANSSFQNIACRLETRSPSSINDEAKDDWTTLQVLPSVSEIISLALEAFATDAPASMGQDSAVVHVVLLNNHAETTNPCPIRTHSQVRVVLEHGNVHDKDDPDIDTANQEARTVAMVGGLLHVTLASTAAGSESDHLPDCYAPLYTNLAHRRQAFSQQRQGGPLKYPTAER